MSDPILIALIRQLVRRDVLSEMDVEAMAIDLAREGFDDAAYSMTLTLLEAHLAPDGSVSGGGNEGD